MKAILYSNGNQECDRAKMLLQSIKGEYIEYYKDQQFTHQQFQMEFGAEAEYPQCTINNEHIGNLKDTLQYLKDHGQFE